VPIQEWVSGFDRETHRSEAAKSLGTAQYTVIRNAGDRLIELHSDALTQASSHRRHSWNADVPGGQSVRWHNFSIR
jgi:hypothetical protein